MLYFLIGYCPHSSPDPFGATLSPGEGIFPLLLQRESVSRGSPSKTPWPADIRRAPGP